MADKLNEQLSALVDNECADHELELALRRLIKETELIDCWQRYQLVSDTLRNQLPQTVSVDFSNRVRVAIDQEAVVMSPAAAEFDDRRSSEWRRPLIGLAAAASVTMAVGLGFMLSSSPDTQESTLAESTIPAVPPVEQLTSRDRLNSYLASHNELASMNGGRGLLPYVQTVYYSNDR